MIHSAAGNDPKRTLGTTLTFQEIRPSEQILIIQPVRIFFALIFVFTGANADEIIGTENEYHEGSVAPTISAQTTENLYLLGKVWGYLKYHHPRATSGCLDWDAQLLEVIGDAVAAENRDDASGRLGRWIHDLNNPSTACDVETPGPVHFSVDKDWVSEVDLLGEELTKAMASIGARSGSDKEQHDEDLRYDNRVSLHA